MTLSVFVSVAMNSPFLALSFRRVTEWACMWSFAMIVSTYFESLSPQARVGSVFWRGRRVAEAREVVVISQSTHVLPLEFNRSYPVLVRGDGVWVEDASGKRYLDAMSGGSMAATLGHGRRDIIAAARAQAEKLAYVHHDALHK